MSVRESALRLQRWRLQERQDYLAGLESLAERLRADARRLGEEAEAGEWAAPYSTALDDEHRPIVRPLVERRHRLERSIVEIEAQIAEAQASVEFARQEVRLAEIGLAPQAAAAPVRTTRRARRERRRHPLPVSSVERTRLF